MLNKPPLQKKQLILFESDCVEKTFTKNFPGQQHNVNIWKKTGHHWICYNDQESRQCSIGIEHVENGKDYFVTIFEFQFFMVMTEDKILKIMNNMKLLVILILLITEPIYRV